MVELKIELPDSFFEEEVRSGFLVTQERKKLWAVELDLLKELDRVCRENEIPYMLGAGSLLGAVRHHGFIPWDDDIDVYLLREDYNRLLSCGQLFTEPYFLQTVHSDRYFIRPFARLRNSNTTGFITHNEQININRGIFIDLFPIDGIGENDRKEAMKEELDEIYKRFFSYWVGLSVNTTMQKINQKIVRFAFALLGKGFFIRLLQNNETRDSRPGTRIWGNRTISFNSPRTRRPLEDYTNLIMAEFEGFQFPIPANYDAMLKQQYGDYMEIPEVKPASFHGELTVSADVSYRDFCKT